MRLGRCSAWCRSGPRSAWRSPSALVELGRVGLTATEPTDRHFERYDNTATHPKHESGPHRVPGNPDCHEVRPTNGRTDRHVYEVLPLSASASATPVRSGRMTSKPRPRATSSSGLHDDGPTSGLWTSSNVDVSISRPYSPLSRHTSALVNTQSCAWCAQQHGPHRVPDNRNANRHRKLVRTRQIDLPATWLIE